MTMLCIGVTAEVEAPVSFPYTGEEVVFSGFGYDGLDQNPELPCIQAWQEHIGNIKVDYEFLAYSDYLEKYKIMLSTGDMPDILPVPNIRGVIAQYGDTGMLLDFSKYLDYICLLYTSSSANPRRFAIRTGSTRETRSPARRYS